MTTELAALAGGSFLNIAALLFLLFLLDRNVLMERNREQAYRLCVIFTIIIMLAEVACLALDSAGPQLWLVNALCNAVGFTLSGTLPYLLAAVYDERVLQHKRSYAIPAAALGTLCLLSIRFGWIFFVSVENVYVRGPLFWIYPVVYLGGVVLLLRANLRQASRLCREERIYLAVLYVLFLIGISLQLLFPVLHTSWSCVTLFLLLYYIFQRELQFKYDQLTGVLNRASFEKDTSRSLSGKTAVILFDLDDFKNINDTYGHQTGDECLKSIAAILWESFEPDRCYRIGGDEFLVLSSLREKELKETLRALVQKIRALRESDAILPNISYGYGILIPGEPFQTAFQRADRQMYAFKRRKGITIRNVSSDF